MNEAKGKYNEGGCGQSVLIKVCAAIKERRRKIVFNLFWQIVQII